LAPQDQATRAAQLCWHLAQVRPNAFVIAERNLRRQGFAVFAPTLAQTIRRRGRFVVEQKPLFPGYHFIGISAEAAPWVPSTAPWAFLGW